MSFEDDFLQGQRDCRDGVPHEQGKSDAYTRGYGTQYERDQLRSEMTNIQNERISSSQRG